MTIVKIENLKFGYSSETEDLLNDISFSLENNQILCLLGPSGCGKSSLLKLIAGLMRPSKGRVYLYNKLVSQDEQLLLLPQYRQLAMIFQDYALFPHMTIFQNVAFGLKKLKLSKTELSKRVMDGLIKARLEDLLDKYPHELSGGQQQRVAVVRSLVTSPKLLLLDEPFSNLDPLIKNELMSDIRKLLKGSRTSAIFVTHSRDEAYAFADLFALMYQGKIEQIGTSQDLYLEPKTAFVAQFFSSGSFYDCHVLDNLSVKTVFGFINALNIIPFEKLVATQIYLRMDVFEVVYQDKDHNAELLDIRFIEGRYEAKVLCGGLIITCHIEHRLLLGSCHLRIKAHSLILF